VGNDLSAMLIAILAVLVLVFVMRWIFTPSHRSGPDARLDASKSTDLGMLTVVLSDLSRSAAMQARSVLGDAGLRSSMSRRRDGKVDVLVFRDDVARARALLS
jgi:DNA-binding transcriptional ArsR family regulator